MQITIAALVVFFSFAHAVVAAPNCDQWNKQWNRQEYFKTATVESVKACLEAGADPNARNYFKKTPLHSAAAFNENADVIQALLEAGADPNARNFSKETPLHDAAFNENPMIIQALLEAGADPNARDEDKGMPLHYAAEYNENPMIIQALLEGGADPKARNVYGATPLEISKQFKNLAVIEFLRRPGGPPILSAQDCRMWPTSMYFRTATVESVKACLEADAALMIRNESEETPLHRAAQHSKTPGVIEALLAAGADPNAQAKNNWTPLHSAAEIGNLVAIQALLDAGADAEASTGQGSVTPLYLAAKIGNLAAVQALLAAGADVEATAKGGSTALSMAGGRGNVAVIKALLAAGADPMKYIWGSGAGGADPTTPLDEATHPAVIELLLAAVKTAGQDCNLWNTKRYFQGATPESVTACLGAGSNPREKDAAGITPLHRAARYNENPAVTQILLDAGADVEARDVGGFTPLRWVVNERFWDPGGNENLAVIQALLDVGADPEAQDDDGDTLLHVAIREVRRAYNRMNRGSHYPAVIQMLLDAGADPEARHRHGCPPLHLVAGDDEIPTVVTEALLAAGANPKMKDDSDRTPLHMAAGSHSNPEVIQALLAAGADLEARDDEGRTPLHMAAGQYPNPEVIQALLAAGADLEARDDEGDTPLHRVAAYTHSYDHRNVVATVMALLATGANPLARNGVGKTPWDLAQANEKLKGSDAYWRLKKVLLEAPGEGARRSATTSPEPAGNVGVPAGVPACQIPNYPNPPGGVANLGFSWCPASIGMQVRAFALQAAGAQCAIATESSSTPEQIEARQREIKAACDRLASLGQGNCQCPPGLAQ